MSRDTKVYENYFQSQVHSECSFLAPISYPHPYLGGLAVSKLGNSSVEYRVALFKQRDGESLDGVKLNLLRGHFAAGDEDTVGAFADEPACVGRFTHVFVDAETNRPEKLKEEMRGALKDILVEQTE